MMVEINCREFIKRFQEDIEAYMQSISTLILGASLEGIISFLQYEGVHIYLHNGKIYMLPHQICLIGDL